MLTVSKKNASLNRDEDQLLGKVKTTLMPFHVTVSLAVLMGGRFTQSALPPFALDFVSLWSVRHWRRWDSHQLSPSLGQACTHGTYLILCSIL